MGNDVRLETDVPLPVRNPWKVLAEKATPGSSAGGLTKEDAARYSNALRSAGHGATTADDPKAEGRFRVWCVEKVKRAKPKPRTKPAAGKPHPGAVAK